MSANNNLNPNQSLFNVELIKIEDIQVVNANIENLARLSTFPRNARYSNNIDFVVNTNFEHKKIQCIITASVTVQKKEALNENILSGKFEVATYFDVNDIPEVMLLDKNGQVSMEKELVLLLQTISYSTTRGVISGFCHGTVLSKWILPILSVKTIGENLTMPDSE